MPRGKTQPRLWTKPKRPLTPETSLGFEAVEFARTVLGLEVLPWQEWVLIHALELNPDGTFRFRTVVLLVARQNGKTTLVQILALWRLFVDSQSGPQLVIGTAQNLDLSEEAWAGCVEMAEGTPELEDEITSVVRVNGKKALILADGSKYKVAAASRKGGRGLSGDLVLLDELREHQTWEAWGAVTKTTMARARAQVWAYSNAGDAKSVVLNHLVAQARLEVEREENDTTVGLFEYSAPDGCELDDLDAIAQANPSLGYTISLEAILSALRTDPEPVYRTEVLCQSVDALDIWATTLRAGWPGCRDPRSELLKPIAFGLEVALDRRRAYIGVVGRREDDLPHVEIADHRMGSAWVVERLEGMALRHGLPVVIDPSSPAGSFIDGLRERGVTVETPTVREIAQACGRMYDAITEGQQFRHRGQTVLDDAVASATKRPTADAWRWGREEGADVAALYAVTMAYTALPVELEHDLLSTIA